jgi:hypothetical protein
MYTYTNTYNCRVRIVPSKDTLEKTLKRRKLVKDHAEIQGARRSRINAQIAADILEKENEELRYIYIYVYICLYVYLNIYMYNAQIAADVSKKKMKN